MRRPIIAISVLVFLAMLLLPAAALAGGSWVVRNAAGNDRGRAFINDGHWDVYGGGVQFGYVTNVSSGGSRYAVWYGTEYGGSGTRRAIAVRVSSSRCNLRSLSSTTVTGRAVRSGDHWVLQKRVNGTFKKRGTVNGHCPAALAAGALRLILW